MGKLLFWTLIGVALYALYRATKRRQVRQDADQRASRPEEVEDMVRCAVCKVNLPRSEAILTHGHFYCCDAHRQQDENS